jgi:hypothetical protein
MVLAVLAGLLVSLRADAHALGAECKVIGDRVALEAYYDDDTPARDATVRVEDADKNVVATGHTDREGRWSFARPQPGKYVVVVDAGAGHRTRITLAIPAGQANAEAAPSTSAGDECPRCAEPSTPNSEAPVQVSAEASREAFTAFPWLKLGVGLAVLAGIGVTAWVFRALGR